MSNFILTDDNYYSAEANLHYFSCSQYEEFNSCEAAALAHIRGQWSPPETEAFFLGKYFHSYFEGKEAHKKFCNEHFDSIYKTKTTKSRGVEVVGKYSGIQRMDTMIEAAEADPAIWRIIDTPGANEVIMHGKLFGRYPWRIRIDKHIPSMNMIVDWKTVADIYEAKYSAEYGRKVSFVEMYHYMFRAAVYTEIYKQFTGNDKTPLFWLVCLSKQDPPDKAIVNLTHPERYEYELEKVREKIYRYQSIKDGLVAPTRCGKCDYCRATKELTGTVDYWELDPDYGREKDVEDVYGVDAEV